MPYSASASLITSTMSLITFDIIELGLYYYLTSQYNDTFTAIERLLLVFAMQYSKPNSRLFLATRYCQYITTNEFSMLNCIHSLSYCDIDVSTLIVEYVKVLVKNRGEFIRLFCITIICALASVSMYKWIDVNTRRKIFHFSIYFVFVRQNELAFLSGYLLLYFLVALQDIAKLFKGFLSKNDKGRKVFSHILLLGACVLASEYLKGWEYNTFLIAICFQDSAASFFGTLFGKKEKSLIGLSSGVLVAIVVYAVKYQLQKFPKAILYFILVGLVEYLVPVNDSLSIPFATIIFYKLKRQLVL